jgi:hypothetical protein
MQMSYEEKRLRDLIESYVKPLHEEIKQLRKELGKDKPTETRIEREENWSPDWQGDPDDERRWKGW